MTKLPLEKPLPAVICDLEGEIIKDALEQSAGSITKAAKSLKISYQALGYILNTRHPELRWTPKIARKGKQTTTEEGETEP